MAVCPQIVFDPALSLLDSLHCFRVAESRFLGESATGASSFPDATLVDIRISNVYERTDCMSCLCYPVRVGHTQFSGLGRISMQALVSYPSIVWGVVTAISVMLPSGTVNVDKGIPSFRHGGEKKFRLGSGSAVGLYV